MTIPSAQRSIGRATKRALDDHTISGPNGDQIAIYRKIQRFKIGHLQAL